MSDDDQMVIAEGHNTTEANDVDLKCAEKVTDSDNEEASGDTDASQAAKLASELTIMVSNSNTNTTNTTSNKVSRDFTCKPKAVKAQRQNIDSTLMSYKQIPMYAFNSPKNPTGILPFQPTG